VVVFVFFYILKTFLITLLSVKLITELKERKAEDAKYEMRGTSRHAKKK